MPPRKRKAAQGAAAAKLQPIHESSPLHEQASASHATDSLKHDHLLRQLDGQVQEQCHDIISAASKASQALRSEFEGQIGRLSKKVREQSVASLLNLSEREAASTDLGPILERLAALLDPSFCEDEDDTSQPADQATTNGANGEGEGRAAMAQAAAATQRAAADEQQAAAGAAQEQGQDAGAAGTSSGEGSPMQGLAAARPPSPPPAPAQEPARRATRATRATAATAGPAATPAAAPARATRSSRHATGAAAAAAATPAAAARQAAMETPFQEAAGAGGVGAAPGSARFTGFSILTRTVAGTHRGQGRRRGDMDDAIMINTTDGQQFMIDADMGLDAVPEQYRAEVAQQLEVMQRLVAAALMRR